VKLFLSFTFILNLKEHTTDKKQKSTKIFISYFIFIKYKMNSQEQFCSCTNDEFSCQANRFCNPELDDGNNPICVKDKPGCSMCNDYFDYKDNSNLPFCNYSLPQADHGCLRDEDGGINKDLYFNINEYHKDLDKCLLMDNSRTTNRCVEKLYQEFGKPFTDNKAFGTASEIQTRVPSLYTI
jgi:hypothetical protein